MNLEFNKVTYDGDLEDADEDALRSHVEQFEQAQEANAAEFEAAKEKLDEIEDVDVEEFHDARSDLIETISEYDAFEESPLVEEDDLEVATFSKLREYDAYFAEQDADGDNTDGEFSDMGTESPEEDNEQSDADFAAETLGDIPGVNFQ